MLADIVMDNDTELHQETQDKQRCDKVDDRRYCCCDRSKLLQDGIDIDIGDSPDSELVDHVDIHNNCLSCISGVTFVLCNFIVLIII